MSRKVLQLRHCLAGQSGVSLIELVVTMVILGILAGLIMPSVQIAGRRLKEVELRRNLRVIRTALDEFKKASD
jgi:general secretion pathway protein G